MAKLFETTETENDQLLELVALGKKVPVQSPHKKMIEDQLSWKYSYMESANFRSKQSVSEVKRQKEILSIEDSGLELTHSFNKPVLNRPQSMQEKSLSPAERGTAMHMVMQHIQLDEPITAMSITAKLNEMVKNELLTEEQREVIDASLIEQFFSTELGQRMLKAKEIKREIPFSFSLPAKEVYSEWKGGEEQVLIQGIIDCLFEDRHGLVLLDYKTDQIHDRFKGGFKEAEPILKDRYEVQIDLYARALEEILKRDIHERYLFFFDGAHLMKL